MRLKILITATVLAALYLLFGYRLAERDLTSSHEARAAMDAQSLLDDGDWVLPHLYDGSPELQKPPLYYWLVALLGRCQGGTVGPLAVRLPAMGSALGCLLMLVGFGYTQNRLGTGVTAALVLATSIHFTSLAHTARIDMPLTLTVALATVAFYSAGKETGWRQLLLQLTGCLALAAGALLKGPIGVVLPLAILTVNAMVTRCLLHGRPAVSLRFLAWAIPLVVVLVLPWYVAVHLRTEGTFTRVFFWYHNLTRGLGGSDLRAHPWWFYGPYLIYGLLPWSLLIPLVAWQGWRLRLWQDDEYRFGLVWLVTVVVLLSLARFKRADYLAPAYPGAAWVLAHHLPGPFLGRFAWPRWERAWQIALLLAILVVTSIGWAIYAAQPSPSATANFATKIREIAPRPAEILFFRTEAHLLACHLGRPQRTLVEWQELVDSLLQPGPHWVVTSPDSVVECQRLLPSLRCQVLLRMEQRSGGVSPERPLVLLWAYPQ
jgi:4-amino-4-deoxy-L-arabinose transferase-like glycosyltransferase